MFHIPNLVRYLERMLNSHWDDFRRGHGVGSGQYMSWYPGLIFFKMLELDKSWNGAHLNMIPPICHAGRRCLLVENYSLAQPKALLASWKLLLACLGHGSSWTAFLLCHLQQTIGFGDCSYVYLLSIIILTSRHEINFYNIVTKVTSCSQGL